MVNIPVDSMTVRDAPFGEIERRVQKHPFVRTVSAFRGSGDAIMLQVQERKPIAYALYRNKQYYVDTEGALLPYRLVGSVLDIPMITYIQRSVLDSTTLRGALAILQTLNENDKELSRNISEVQVMPNGEYVLVTIAQATPILFGKADDAQAKIARLSAFWKQKVSSINKRAFSYIDVRWSGQVVVFPL